MHKTTLVLALLSLALVQPVFAGKDDGGKGGWSDGSKDNDRHHSDKDKDKAPAPTPVAAPAPAPTPPAAKAIPAPAGPVTPNWSGVRSSGRDCSTALPFVCKL